MGIIITSATGRLSFEFNSKSSIYGHVTLDIPSNFTTISIPHGTDIVVLSLFDNRPSLKLNPSDVDIPAHNGTALDLRNKILAL